MKTAHLFQFDLFSHKRLSSVTTLAELIEQDKQQREALLEARYPNHQKLVVLSFGGGQDSTAMLYKYVYDPLFRKEFAPQDFIVVMSDTGDEHDETYGHVEAVKAFCQQHHIKFFFLTADMGYHGATWPSLRQQYRRTSTCGSKAFRKNCTDNLKIKVIYRFLEDYLKSTYQLLQPVGDKATIKEFVENHGKITVLIGIAKGEEKRIKKPKNLDAWMLKCVDRRFPLVELGMDRKGCQDYIRSVGHRVPPPSNCKLCPYMDEIELLWLYYNHPEDFAEWVEIEANKVAKFASREVNLGVWADGRLLPQVLEDAKKQFSHLTKEQLNEYKFSHGHCVASQY